MNQNISKNIYPVQTNSAFTEFIKNKTKEKHQKQQLTQKNKPEQPKKKKQIQAKA